METNNDFLKINEKASIMADIVEPKNFGEIMNQLQLNTTLDEYELYNLATQMEKLAIKVANSINQKISERNLTVANLLTSDDKLVLNYEKYAEKEINTLLKKKWVNINMWVAKIIAYIENTTVTSFLSENSSTNRIPTLTELDKKYGI